MIRCTINCPCRVPRVGRPFGGMVGYFERVVKGIGYVWFEYVCIEVDWVGVGVLISVVVYLGSIMETLIV